MGPEDGGPEGCSLEGFIVEDPKSSVVSLTQSPKEGGPNSCLEGFFGEEPKSSRLLSMVLFSRSRRIGVC